jgi:hypothetical protein
MPELRDAIARAAVSGASVELPGSVCTVVLVEGASDLAAVEAAARVVKADLDGVLIVAMGGAMSIRRFMAVLDGAVLSGVRIIGLCDIAEAGHFEQAGVETLITCEPDLEGELMRALGFSGVLDVLERERDLAAFRVFQNQPAQRERDLDRQLHRFFGTIGGRKEKYGRALTAALAPENLPEPLARLLAEL